jgi:predicted GIY-YIG superfamily endonuclease
MPSQQLTLKEKLQAQLDCGEIRSREILYDIASQNGGRIVRDGRNYLTILLPNGDRFRLKFNFESPPSAPQPTPLLSSAKTPFAKNSFAATGKRKVHSVYALIAISPAGSRACYIGLTVDLNRRLTEHLKRSDNEQTSHELFVWAQERAATVYFQALSILFCSQSEAMKCESHWGKLAMEAGFETPGSERWLKKPKFWLQGNQPLVWPTREIDLARGNPPKNPSVVKVEISMKEFLHEKEQIHRQP